MIRAVEFIDETLNLVFIYSITLFALFVIIIIALLNVSTYHILVAFNIV